MKTCKEVHRLVIEGQDRTLPLSHRIAVRLHLMMCSACRRFEAQMNLLRQALRRFPGD
ncbi:zf-HC2 domain-containing protein [Azospira restricta]|uniref:Zf-HC2 domain-containing protein n=1 Tax=Azospira restricta TaxID=404405 RepID=A0A974Y593_9RHOO|nr:zf-HC2 domain-containing protein [Azospira restricta]QRJ65121.1 zf-HC2 domain-containing protein [Azospira restricta]